MEGFEMNQLEIFEIEDEDMPTIQNPGSALGEAIGAHMELALNRYLAQLVDQYSCRLISKGPLKKGKATKLLLYDDYGTAYNIDSVVTNEANQPLILVEYKYIRYKKHNRDKGSWVCTAHNAVRRRYSSIRSSIAILAGSWSKSSVAMMKSHEINIFIIPFDKITELLKAHDIVFDWGEKDRHVAQESWEKYSKLTPLQKFQIAEDMIAVVKDDVEAAINLTLDNQASREITRTVVEIHTNLGEVRWFEFNTIQDAIEFLEDFTIEEILKIESGYTLLDIPVFSSDDE